MPRGISALGDSCSGTPSPTHDSDGTMPLSQIVTMWYGRIFIGADLSPDQMTRKNPCSLELAPSCRTGARGVTIENRSDFYFEVQVDGPGYVLGSRTVGLFRASSRHLLSIPLELLLTRSSTMSKSKSLPRGF